MINDSLISKAHEFYKSCQYKEAISCLESIIKNQVDCEEIYFYLGMCYEKLCYEEKAVMYYKKGLAMCEDDMHISDYHLNIGKNLIMLSRLSEALYHFEKSSEHEGNRLYALYNKTMVYMCQKKYADALEMLEYLKGKHFCIDRIEQLIEYCQKKMLSNK